jgi:hypothetical protein
VRLKAERKVTEGVFLRTDKAPLAYCKTESNSEDPLPRAPDLYSQSVVTKHLIGRSTWDRVVGMHSEFARMLIASRLKDTRLVFVVNTAGSEQKQGTPLPPELPQQLQEELEVEQQEKQQEKAEEELVQSYLKSQDFLSYLQNRSSPSQSPSLPVVRIPITQMHPPIDELPPASASVLQPVSSSPSGQISFAIHEPTTPKPSFSPRKRLSSKLNPSVLIPLT